MKTIHMIYSAVITVIITIPSESRLKVAMVSLRREERGDRLVDNEGENNL